MSLGICWHRARDFAHVEHCGPQVHTAAPRAHLQAPDVMAPSVPIIDMSDFEARRDEVTAQLMEAAENIGFFQVRLHVATLRCTYCLPSCTCKLFSRPSQ